MQCPILIFEDELIIAESLAELLTDEMFTVAGIASNYSEAKPFFLRSSKPELVISDINLKEGENGVEIIHRLRKNYDFEVIYLTIKNDIQTIEEAEETRPFFYLVKPFTSKQLLVTVQMAVNRIYKKRNFGHIPLELSQRELEIAMLISQGYSSKEIADQLFISTETVRTHRKNMLQRNNLRSFSQLIFLLTRS